MARSRTRYPSGWYPGALWLWTALLLAAPSSAGLSPPAGPVAVAGVGEAADPPGPSLAGLAPMGGPAARQGAPGGLSPAAEAGPGQGPGAPVPAPPPGAAPGASQLSSRTVSTKYGDLRGVIVNLENRHLEPVEVSVKNILTRWSVIYLSDPAIT